MREVAIRCYLRSSRIRCVVICDDTKFRNLDDGSADQVRRCHFGSNFCSVTYNICFRSRFALKRNRGAQEAQTNPNLVDDGYDGVQPILVRMVHRNRLKKWLYLTKITRYRVSTLVSPCRAAAANPGAPRMNSPIKR